MYLDIQNLRQPFCTLGERFAEPRRDSVGQSEHVDLLRVQRRAKGRMRSACHRRSFAFRRDPRRETSDGRCSVDDTFLFCS